MSYYMHWKSFVWVWWARTNAPSEVWPSLKCLERDEFSDYCLKGRYNKMWNNKSKQGWKSLGPAQLKFGPNRPGPVHLNLRAGTARPGPICQAWDLQPWYTEPVIDQYKILESFSAAPGFGNFKIQLPLLTIQGSLQGSIRETVKFISFFIFKQTSSLCIPSFSIVSNFEENNSTKRQNKRTYTTDR